MLLTGNVIDLGLRVTLQDNFTQRAKGIKDAVKGIRGEIQAYQENLRAARNMYGGLAAAGTMAMAKMWQGFEKGAHFDYVVKGAAVAAGAVGKQFEGLYTLSNNLGSKMGFLPEKIADAMQLLGKAGIDARGIMEALRPVMNLAGGSMEDLSTSADIAISTMYQFGYQAKDMGYISDVLAQGAIRSNIGLRDLGESLKYASATAVQLKQDLPTVTAMIMTLGNAGMKGSMSGVGLENMYRYLSMGLGLGEFRNKGRGELLTSLGIDPQSLLDSAGNMKHITEVLGILSNAIKRYGNIDQQNILYKIFGVRGKRPPSVFLQDLAMLRKNLEYINNSRGVAGKMYETMMSGPYGNLQKMKAAWQEMVNDFAKVMTPVVVPLLQALTGFFHGLKSFMGTIGGSFVVRVLTTFITLGTVIAGIKASIAGVALALNLLRTSMVGMNSAINVALSGRAAFMGGVPRYGAPIYSAGTYMGRTYLSNSQVNNPFVQNAKGQWIVAATGMTASKKAVANYFSQFKSMREAYASKLMNNGVPFTQAGQVTANQLASRVGFGGALMGVGRGLLGALGGPWGLALMGISVGLPLLIGALNRNSSSNDRNSQNLEKQIADDEKEKLSLSLVSYLANNLNGLPNFYVKKLYKGPDGKPHEDLVLERLKQMYLSRPEGRFYDLSDKNVLNLYIDGKMVKTIPFEDNTVKVINKYFNPFFK